MKAKIELEINKDDLSYELKELVRELAEDEIRAMIKQQANEMVRAEIDKILHPLVIRVLTEDKFDFNTGYHSYTSKAKLDEKLESMVIGYMNRPSYLYSKDKRKPSERYAASSGGGENTPLINHIVSDEIKLFVDSEFLPKVTEMIKNFVTNKKKLEETFMAQAKQILADNLK